MTRSFVLITLAAAAFSISSCDKHSWKETQVLQEKYSGHGAAHGGGHAESKDSHAAPAAGHGEKPAAHGEKPAGH